MKSRTDIQWSDEHDWVARDGRYYRALAACQVDSQNPSTHSDTQVSQIAASIGEFGFNNPILVDSQSGIIAGHGRLLAAQGLGMTQVPVIVLDHLTDAQKRAYILADNQLALNAGWEEICCALNLPHFRQKNLT